MYRHDTKNIGYSTNTPPTTNDVLWTYQTGDGISSSPAIIHGKVYVGSWDFSLYCFDMETGSVIWEYQTGGRITSSPAVINNRVYFGSRDSYIYCLDAVDGSLIWSYKTGYYIESSPVVVEGNVFIGSADGYLYCLNADDGTVHWKFFTNNIIWSSPAITQGKIYFGSLNGVFYCLNSTTGALIWEYTTGSGIWSSPAINSNRVYIGSNDNILYCFNAQNGSVQWTFSTSNEIHSSPAVAYGMLFFGNNDGKLYCLNSSTGLEQWNFSISGTIQSSPAIADGKVHIGYEACCGFPSFVTCLNATTGSEIWDYNIGMPGMQSSPAIIMEKLFTCSLDGKIRVFGSTPFLADAQGPYQTNVNISIQFNGMAYGGTLDYAWYWEFGDSTTSTQQNPSHTYSQEGTYLVTLTVTDNTKASAYDETYAFVIGENNAPTPPQITGPSQGKIGVEYTYTFQSIDFENEDIYYWINWGDNCPAVEWGGPFQSGEPVNLNHTYDEEGSFTIRSKTKDIQSHESDWSYFETSMPTHTIINKPSNPILQMILFFLQYINDLCYNIYI
jgi:outer membrane protein assembly factor BamB